MNRKSTERFGVMGGEHGDEEQADRVVAHALKKVQVRALFANGDVLDLTLTTAFWAQGGGPKRRVEHNLSVEHKSLQETFTRTHTPSAAQP